MDIEALKAIESAKRERELEAIARCILTTLTQCRETALKLPDDKKQFGWGYVGGLANALATVCLFSGNEELCKAAREYTSDAKAEVAEK